MTERQIFAIYDEDGNYNGFYPTDIWDIDKIPTENRIELTYDEWQEGIYNRCKVVDGKHTIIPVTEDEQSQTELISVRFRRSGLLMDSDWTQFNDSPLNTKKKNEWALYRQALRDMTNTTPYVYPTEPN